MANLSRGRRGRGVGSLASMLAVLATLASAGLMSYFVLASGGGPLGERRRATAPAVCALLLHLPARACACVCHPAPPAPCSSCSSCCAGAATLSGAADADTGFQAALIAAGLVTEADGMQIAE